MRTANFPRLIFCFLLCALCSCVAVAKNDFQLGDVQVKRGERVNFSLAVPAGDQDPATSIPLTVLAGASDGPTAVIVAGVHGFEFAPILAADRIAGEISPAELSGTIVLVRVAHVAAFENRSPYVNPHDRKNLNRSFPGSASGTQTERIAHRLSSTVIPAADFVFDVHSGDGAEWLDAFVGVYGGPLATGYKKALAAAQAMGFPNIVRYSMNTQEQVDTRRSLNRQAVAQGVATVLVEVGENGKRDTEHINMIVDGIRGALTSLGMLHDQKTPAGPSPRYFDGTQSVIVKHSGLWNPAQSIGRRIVKGEVLGVIKSYSGETVETVRAPISGYAIYGLAGPPVKSGDSVMSIAKPTPRLD